MPRRRTNLERLQVGAWRELLDVVDVRILQAPSLDWDQVDGRAIRYLKESVAGTAWINPLALMVGVLLTSARLNVATVLSRLYGMHVRWQDLFARYQLRTFADWDPCEHLPRYLNDEVCADSVKTKQDFLFWYRSSADHMHDYVRALPADLQAIYGQWEFPLLPRGIDHQLDRMAEVIEDQRHRRQVETDALTPHFAKLRGEAHLRWNQLFRLRTKVGEVIALVTSGQASCPVAFSYEETHPRQRVHARLWDRRSFVLAHADQYSRATGWEARRQIRAFRPGNNTYFLEVVGTELLDDPSPGLMSEQFLWFGDVLRYDLLSEGPCLGTPEEVKRKQAYLHSWGYEIERRCKPFSSGIAGLLAWPFEQANFLRKAQARAQGPLLLVEPLFAAVTFGLAALDFFTTTGARMNELLQVRLTADCLYTMVVEGTQRLLVRLLPKGMTRLAEYVVGPETRRHFERVALMLQDHYGLRPGEPVPAVAFCKHHGRAALFPGHHPYLFQYGGQHLSPSAITACLRFLCHGMVFETVEGKAVVLKAHLLRHVFATHIHHVEQVPLDIVAVLLHQKNTRVTGYYAAPPWHQVLTSANVILDRFATHLGSLDEAFVRAPAELQRQYEEAKERVGTLAKVPGGDCTCL
ncbi:hypothetical protein [Ktedonospora formicarum]|uniref:Tyr recombinase domain-containing protein n=1 Tax=Ktedonospora formicarum TaxID=2778364 RepID=A0A8J3IBW2_9CHLR|nr:hypothetical protein [Ktedonospora formicarum]GHO49234.1 hypothetical protein KSX_73970 [Ktedonospora formicarum]